ncbi:hypothetical protein MASR1M107_14490 [Ignavibacteriales bacterium]
MKNISLLDSLLDDVKNYWTNYLSHFSVETPDEKLNASLNVWNQYQAAVTFDMARNSGYYHGGLLFGNGIRDQFQDILGMLLPEPGRVKARILNALKYQFNDGSTLHNFFKITEWGEKTNHSDTPLWIPFGVTEYLNETGDFSILDEVVKFYDEGEATVYEHTARALDFAISAVSERGLPKIMNGDWNDTLDKVGPRGKGETIWGAFFLGYVIKKTLPLLGLRNDQERIKHWSTAFVHMEKLINEVAWDGDGISEPSTILWSHWELTKANRAKFLLTLSRGLLSPAWLLMREQKNALNQLKNTCFVQTVFRFAGHPTQR